MGPQLTRIVEQVGKNLPQIVMREIGKIVRPPPLFFFFFSFDHVEANDV